MAMEMCSHSFALALMLLSFLHMSNGFLASPKNFRGKTSAISSLLSAPHLKMSEEAPQVPQVKMPRLVGLKDFVSVEKQHYFSDEANWLVPGHVLLGRYPGNDPYIRCTPEEQKRKVERIVKEGRVTAFVCLQVLLIEDYLSAIMWYILIYMNDGKSKFNKSEIPPQTVENMEDFDDNSPYSDNKSNQPHWENNQILSGHPRLGGSFTRYSTDAISAFESRDWYTHKEKIDFLHLPIADLSPTKCLDMLHDYVYQVKETVVENQETVYLHCWGGCGRTGLVSACLLGHLYPGMCAEEALARVDTYFKLRSPDALAPHSRSPETDAQIKQVKDYYACYIEKEQLGGDR